MDQLGQGDGEMQGATNDSHKGGGLSLEGCVEGGLQSSVNLHGAQPARGHGNSTRLLHASHRHAHVTAYTHKHTRTHINTRSTKNGI